MSPHLCLGIARGDGVVGLCGKLLVVGVMGGGFCHKNPEVAPC